MAELVDALDSKSGVLWTCGFESHPGYNSGQLAELGDLSAFFLGDFRVVFAQNVENGVDAKSSIMVVFFVVVPY